jgi:hypothetical protein
MTPVRLITKASISSFFGCDGQLLALMDVHKAYYMERRCNSALGLERLVTPMYSD